MACTCVHVYMCMRAHVYMCTCEHALHTCVHANANACVRACIRVRANACVRTCECMRANMHTCTCECMCTRVHAHARACIAYMRETTTDIRTETHRYTLIHTYTVLFFCPHTNTRRSSEAQKGSQARHGTGMPPRHPSKDHDARKGDSAGIKATAGVFPNDKRTVSRAGPAGGK